MRSLRRLLLPDGLLLAAGLLVARVDALREAAGDAAMTLVIAAVVIGALLSLRFHRGRVLLVLLLVGLVHAVLIAPLPSPTDRAAFALTAVLAPVAVGVLALLPERGALSTAGLVRFSALVIVAIVAAALAYWSPEQVVAVLERPLVPARVFGWTSLPQPAIAAGLAALLLFLILWAREPSPVARGLFWSLLAVLLALHSRGPGPEPSIWLATAGLVLVLAVVESSYALAYHDTLTGLPGRRALGEALGNVGAGDRYTVAMVDVDHFKQCNDRWGHDVGDHVLRMVAARLAQVTGGGRAFRYGGEEFALLFPGLAASDARAHVEQLRRAVEASPFAVRHRPRPRKRPAAGKPRRAKVEPIAVTISVGLAEGDARQKPEAVIAAADQALYRANERGRNRVEE